MVLDQAVDSLVVKGWAEIEIDLRADLEKMYLYFKEIILNLPEEVKREMCLDLSPNSRPDHGLVRREDRGGDWKYFFHFRPWDKEHPIQKFYKDKGISIPDFDQFCQGLKDITEKYLACLLGFISEFDRQYGFSLAEDLIKAKEKHVIRFLYYDPNQPRDDLAEVHNDFGLLTVAAYETHRGLWLGKKSNLYQPRDGKTLVFVGRKFTSATGWGVGLCHGVVKTPCFDPTLSRGAIVMFFHGLGEMGPSCPS